MAVTQVQLDALLGAGKISTEQHAALSGKVGKEQDKAFKLSAKQAEKDLVPTGSNIGSFNTAPAVYNPSDPFGLVSGAPAVVPNAPAAPPQPGLFGLTPEQMFLKAKHDAGQKATPEEVAKITEAAKTKDAIPTNQIAGGKSAPAAQPAAPAAPAAPATLNLPSIGGRGGVGNIFSGPSDQEKYLTPGEKERKTQIAEAEHLRGDILGQGVELQQKEDQQVAEIRARQAQEYKLQIDHDAEVRKKENEIVQDNLKMLTEESKKLGDKKIDPTRAFQNAGTAGSVLAVVGLFFGAGGTKKGGVNPALEQMNKMVDRDIKMQEFDIQNQGKSIDQRRGLLQDRVSQFGNNELARTAAKKDYIDVIEMQIKSVLAGNQSEKTQLKGQDLLAGLQEAKDKTMFEFSQLNDQRARKLAAASAARSAAFSAKQYENFKAQRNAVLKLYESGKISSPDGSIAPVGDVINNPSKYDLHDPGSRAARMAMEKDIRGRTVTLNVDPSTGATIPGRQLMAQTEKEATALRNSQETFQAANSKIEKLIEIRKSHGGGFSTTLNPTDAGKASALRASILLDIKNMEKSGALDEGSIAVISGMIPEDASKFGWSADAQLKQTQDMIRSNFAQKLNSKLTAISSANQPASPSALGFKPAKKE